jgi:basic amino acid/polyamine antiporter, APA family
MTDHRQVGLKTAIAIVIGNMVGVAVFTSVGFQVLAGHSALTIFLLWTLGAVVALLGALSYAELAGMFPQSGGEYHYLNQAYPPSVGFLSGWITMIAGFPAPIAIGAQALGQYVIGGISGEIPPGNALSVKLLGMVAIGFITLMHCFNLNRSSRFHGGFTLLKIGLLVVLIIGGLWVPAHPQRIITMPEWSGWDWAIATQVFISLYYIGYAYTGWNSACYISGEVRDPQRNVPRALLLGIGVVFVLYALVNLAFVRATAGTTLAESGMAAGLAAAQAIFGPTGARFIALGISLSLISFLSGMVWAGPRVTQRMGQDYTFFNHLAKTNRAGIPRNAILLQSIIATAFLWLYDDPGKLFLYIEFLLQVSVFLTVLSVIILRVRKPSLPRPMRTWGYPLTPILFLLWIALSMGFFLKSRHHEATQGLMTLFAGLIVHLICKSTPARK